ncbi:MAG: secondary thiamine-phosphate synthase enzyme [Nitrospinae bacterium CG11_big_fil_rev_8_21_14_0_20_56_8]|nr:MAG: secondary thiamine-phosphate synthase enzyme [Nitrospinae bacterium CG11_big_fil_rev_8_21_14_0_20_56_8]
MSTQVKTSSCQIATQGFGDILDITGRVAEEVRESGFQEGIATVFVPGSTAGITTIEYESGAVEDLKKAIERLAPMGIPYAHDSRWGDGNGFAHVRAALMNPSLTVPFSGGELLLGTWQQIVLCDFDNRPRNRKFLVQVLGS